jgi:hypothetical protein
MHEPGGEHPPGRTCSKMGDLLPRQPAVARFDERLFC